MPAAVWAWLEYGQHYEPVERHAVGHGMVRAASPRSAAIDLAWRLECIGHKLTADDLDALWRETPADFRTAEIVMQRRFQKARSRPGAWPLRASLRLRPPRSPPRGRDPDAPGDRVAIEEGNCALDLEACFALAARWSTPVDEAEAAAEYERVLADRASGASRSRAT